MKIDQIAWYAHNSYQVDAIKKRFGLLDKKWVRDEAVGDVLVHGWIGGKMKTTSGISSGQLLFNYDLGIELEILTYIDGPHWHMDRKEFLFGQPFLSHVGIHMEPGEVEPDEEENIVQEMTTFSHTNEYVVSRNRTYKYVIRDTTTKLGCFTKYIWRIEP